MWWWVDDLFHEFVTVGFGALALFGVSFLFGCFLRTTSCRLYPLAFRWASLSLFFVGSYFSLELLMEDSLEVGFVAELYVCIFIWSALVGFERRWFFKDIFSRYFWFPVKNNNIHEDTAA